MSKQAKRIASRTLAQIFLLALLPGSDFAAVAVAGGESGAEGNNLTWMLDSAGTLTISGSGDMRDMDTGTRSAA